MRYAWDSTARLVAVAQHGRVVCSFDPTLMFNRAGFAIAMRVPSTIGFLL
jgi:hypothetical protein